MVFASHAKRHPFSVCQDFDEPFISYLLNYVLIRYSKEVFPYTRFLVAGVIAIVVAQFRRLRPSRSERQSKA